MAVLLEKSFGQVDTPTARTHLNTSFTAQPSISTSARDLPLSSNKVLTATVSSLIYYPDCLLQSMRYRKQGMGTMTNLCRRGI
jgi:hypothetical protein